MGARGWSEREEGMVQGGAWERGGGVRGRRGWCRGEHGSEEGGGVRNSFVAGLRLSYESGHNNTRYKYYRICFGICVQNL